LLIGVSLLGLPASAMAASIGFVPNSFTDKDNVSIRYQHKAITPRGKVLVKVRVRDGASQTANIVFEDSKWVTFVPGVLMDVDFGPISALGSKASGLKLRAEGGIVNSDQVYSYFAAQVITKQCKKAGSGKYAPVTCRWARFRPY
jgi:hypothetical protein